MKKAILTLPFLSTFRIREGRKHVRHTPGWHSALGRSMGSTNTGGRIGADGPTDAPMSSDTTLQTTWLRNPTFLQIPSPSWRLFHDQVRSVSLPMSSANGEHGPTPLWFLSPGSVHRGTSWCPTPPGASPLPSGDFTFISRVWQSPFAFPSKVLYIQELLQSTTPLSWVWLRDLNGRPQTSAFSLSPDLGPGRGLAAPSLSSPVGRCTAAPS